jgi:hypothetical protein
MHGMISLDMKTHPYSSSSSRWLRGRKPGFVKAVTNSTVRLKTMSTTEKAKMTQDWCRPSQGATKPMKTPA